jgi:hypothetical protein
MPAPIRTVPRALLAAASAAALGAALLAAAAPAEVGLSVDGKVRVTFNGSISPRKLPDRGTAPVGVQMGGKISTTDRSEPPILDKIVLDINRNGQLQTRGLARCPLRKIRSISSAGAKRACRSALIGRGSVTSRVSLPGQGAFASNGALLAFNGRHQGRPAIFAQVASGAPLPLTYVIVFEVKKSKGTFGTSLVGTLPPIASEYGYISAFNLSLRRTYRFNGRRLSYASAGCPAPKGFTQANFPLARVKYQFADGRKISSVLVRQCRVRR